MGIPNVPSSNTIANHVSNTPSNPPQNRRPAPQPPQPPTQSSRVAYPPASGVPWKCIAAMMQEDKSCLGCHVNHPDDSPRLKFHQDVGCPSLTNHGYISRKDVTASAKVVYRFNNKFPNMTDQDRTNKPVAKRLSENSSSGQVSARQVHSPSVSNSTLDSTVPLAPIANTFILMPNRVAPIPTSNGYNDLCSLYSDDEPVFKEIVDSKNLDPINTFLVVPQPITLARTPTKVLKKQPKIIGKTILATIKRSHSDKTASACFLSTALHSVSQAITRANTNKISIYNNKYIACCADSGASPSI